MAYWNDTGQEPQGGLEGWKESVDLACRWMIDRSMIKTKDPGLVDSVFPHTADYSDWRGAFKGEYHAATEQWDIFCPVWHCGQGVKALALAHEATGNNEYLDAARQGADFILRHQVTDATSDDLGLLLAYEGGSKGVNTSAILESLDGLFVLADTTGERQYSDAAVSALRWVQRRMFLPDEGLFRDDYDPRRGVVQRPGWMGGDLFPQPGRPLLDDGVFIIGGNLADDDSLKQVASRTADRLLQDEDPPGNWKSYPPAHPVTGIIHPRHAYWWGRPMWMVYKETGDTRYLDCCHRSAEWYVNAMRSDGGLFRNTGPGFKTPSFGHATSGIACASILWMDLIREFGETAWREPLQRALTFCRSVQFTRAGDPDLQGAILEKVLPPDGSDRPPWYLRDVGTFFYVQAVCLAIRDHEELLT